MTIIEEMKKIKFEMLQDEWDKYLINLWYEHADYKIDMAEYIFRDRNKITIEEFNKLKRVTLFQSHSKQSISRFIAANLPALNSALFNKNNTKEAILKFMKKLDTSEFCFDRVKLRKEVYQFKKANKEACAEDKSHSLVKEQRSRTKHHWSITA